MAFEFEIMWDDLTEKAKQQIRDKAQSEGYSLEEDDRNWDAFPIAMVELGSDTDLHVLNLVIGGILQAEDWEKSADTSKIKIYDSDGNYLTYWETETVEDLAKENGVSPAIWLEERYKRCEAADDIDNLLELLGIDSYTASKDWTALLDDFNFDSDELEKLTKEKFLGNDWVNRIGDYYVHVCD